MVAVWKLHPYLAVTHVSIGRIMVLRGPGSSCWAHWRCYHGPSRDKSNVLRHCCLRQWVKNSAEGNNYSGKFSKVSCQWSTLKCPHWSIRVPIQLFNLLRTDKIKREKNNFKVVYPGRFYSLISYSKAEKFNITIFFRSTEQWILMNPDIPLDPTNDRASVGYNTIPKPLVTRPKVSVSTRPHILVSVVFSQILLIWKC